MAERLTHEQRTGTREGRPTGSQRENVLNVQNLSNVPPGTVYTLREAARLVGVSPGRLYRAIDTGRLMAARGGGPGKATLLTRDALQAFCTSEGLTLAEGAERPVERSIAGTLHAPVDPQAIMEVLAERLERSIEQMIDRAVERVAERLIERLALPLERSERSERVERSTPTSKGEVLKRLHALRAEGLSLQAIANQLNAEGLPTLTGRGSWQKGTVSNLLAQAGG
jgi:excisionase family DNA binding protein